MDRKPIPQPVSGLLAKAPTRRCGGGPVSLRVPVVLFLIVTVFFAAVLFVFFFVGLFTNENIAS
jgi:hypothetical protein